MKAIILAAGKGARMQSDMQKVMHPMLGKPVLQYVVEAARGAGFDDITVVVGKDGAEIERELGSKFDGLYFAVQEKPLGTGHAVLAGAGRVAPTDDVLILCGDMPLVTSEFIDDLMKFKRDNFSDAVVAAVYRDDLGDFGRVYDDNSYFIEIVEARDIKNHARTNWANTGIYMFKGRSLLRALGMMKNNNSQGEYYLTDVPKIISEDGKNVQVFHTRTSMSVFAGINTQEHLAEALAHMRVRVNSRHMANGVRMIDPTTTYIDDGIKIGRGVVIYPNVIIEGACEIAPGATIGMGCHLTDTTVGEGVHIRQTVANGAKIGANSDVGPFACLRPGAVIGQNCRVGNFVEIKNANLADGVKAAHLAYIGDADVGKNVNFSCGAITANYDGEKKHRTTIGDNAFIGSNVNLIAPIEIGADAVIAAGSTITDKIPPCALGIARERQCVKLDYKNASQ